MAVRVTTSARLQFGFLNLSLSHERLYGGIGVALDAPTLVVEAEPREGVACDDPAIEEYASRAVEVLGVPGASVRVRERLPRHVGLGSGTQLALATLVAVGRAHDDSVDVRAHAPALGRGGRSGVGVAAFERGGFVVDAGHPSEQFTTARPEDGQWTVPAVMARHELPESWRFVVALPHVERGRSGESEDETIRSVIERADPEIADRVMRLVCQRLLPAAAEGDRTRFGEAIAEIGRRNGRWYADTQDGVYRPPLGTVVETLEDSTAISGAGQSSWGPAVYGVTDVDHVAAARRAARDGFDAAGVDGEVLVGSPRNDGARVERL